MLTPLFSFNTTGPSVGQSSDTRGVLDQLTRNCLQLTTTAATEGVLSGMGGTTMLQLIMPGIDALQQRAGSNAWMLIPGSIGNTGSVCVTPFPALKA